MTILQELISLRGEGRLTYSQEGFLASLFQRQESEGERKMTVTSGRKCFGQYERYDPLGSLVRTLLESPAWYNPAEVTVESQASLFETSDKETLLEQEYVIETVCRDLEREGYSVQPVVIPACSVGAPHRRDRVWFIANRTNSRIEGLRQERKNEIHEFESTSHSNCSRGLQFGERRDIRDKEQYDPDKEPERHEQPSRFGGNGEAYVISDTDSPRFQAKGTGQQTTGIAGSRLQGLITNAEGKQLENTLRAWRRITGSTNLYRKKDWRNFPTQPPVRGRDDGLPFDVDYLAIPFTKWRQESIKAYGNAIVLQVAFEIFKAIEASIHSS